jgi:hypothetical protein
MCVEFGFHTIGLPQIWMVLCITMKNTKFFLFISRSNLSVGDLFVIILDFFFWLPYCNLRRSQSLCLMLNLPKNA